MLPDSNPTLQTDPTTAQASTTAQHLEGLSEKSLEHALEASLEETSYAESATEFPKLNISLLERRISLITIPAILSEISQACRNRQRLLIASCNVHSFNLSLHLPWFYDFMNKADIVRCDGLGILKALALFDLKLPIQYRASGTELVPHMIQQGNEEGLSIFLLGSKEESLNTAIANLNRDYPNLTITGHHGYFDRNDPEQNVSVIRQINQAQPDILLVGMGMPIQEKWIYQNMHKVEASVIMPCGAVIDRLAGEVENCPAWLSNAGFEWAYRLMREPKRLAKRYLAGNLAFALNLLLATAYSNPLKVNRMTLQQMQPKQANQPNINDLDISDNAQMPLNPTGLASKLSA